MTIRRLTILLVGAIFALTACNSGPDSSTPLHQETPHTMTPTTVPSTSRDGESAIYPGDDLDYRDGAWWVDGVKVTGVDCPTEDSCYPMAHDGGWMIHETTP